jgi:hypothetical protein
VIQERSIKLALFNRLPKISQIAPVYAMIVLPVYGWTVLWLFWKLPSWLYFMTVGEILVGFAYAMATNFLESLFVLLIPVLFSLLLPRKWFYDMFVVRGTSLVILLLGYFAFLVFQLQGSEGYRKDLIFLTFPVMGMILFLVYLSGRIGIVRKVIESFSDRAVVFLYLSIPVSLISLSVVTIRNIF